MSPLLAREVSLQLTFLLLHLCAAWHHACRLASTLVHRRVPPRAL